MKGRKRTPTARRVLEGNPSGRALNLDEPKPPPPPPEFDAVPRELLDHDDAAAQWRMLAPMLRQAGQITLADRTALMAACLEWDRYLAAVRALRVGGLVVTTARGEVRPSPYIGIVYKAIASWSRLSSEIGLSPSSRARLSTTPLSPGDDPFREFDTVPPVNNKPQ